MTDTSALDTERTVLLSRRFAAPPEAVFRAWTDPAEIANWYGPDGWHAPLERIPDRPPLHGRERARPAVAGARRARGGRRRHAADAH